MNEKIQEVLDRGLLGLGNDYLAKHGLTAELEVVRVEHTDGQGAL